MVSHTRQYNFSTFTNLCYRVIILIYWLYQTIFGPILFVTTFVLLQPLKLLSKKFFLAIVDTLYVLYMSSAGSWGDLAGHTFLLTGDDVSVIAGEESLLLLNHQTPVDIAVLMRCLHATPNAAASTMWVSDWLIQFIPYGWMAKCHNDFFLLQSVDAKRLKMFFKNSETSNELVRLQKSIVDNFRSRNRKWVIVFPEGGFLSKRRSGSQRFARKNDLPILEHVALPRSGAVQCILDTLGVDGKYPGKNGSCDNSAGFTALGPTTNRNSSDSCPIKWIIDVTIGYKQTMSCSEFIIGHRGRQTIHVHYRIKPASEIITSTPCNNGNYDVTKWLYELFYEKEELLSYFYKHGKFPSENGTSPRVAPLYYRHIIMVNIYVILGWAFIYNICSLCFSLF
uniref:acyl-CoA:lysophosphatidylglycerol acyltransferase 1-like n=1 Tax=Ciona intestinalis TaxID=7719 RepID=UPI000EF45EB3|nr:acyl-CoA:lysophosphatidylglycerol acyltransferase 1-like [Ciona intestinalis]|eukprot:XP_026693395.1 acyl-CoA:lysophosphatidylglycerol acyltransferase 1-like [Ciona intestinalis]